MKRLIPLLFLLIQSGGNTVNVPIVNPSFEQHPNPLPLNLTVGTTVCGTKGANSIPGWQFSITPNSGGFSEVFQPNTTTPTWPCYDTQPPDGSTVAAVGGGSIIQDSGITASSLQTLGGGADGDGVYVMTFYVANFTNVYPGYYEVKLLIGTHELCSTDGWATRNWKQVTFVCPSPDYVVYDNWPPTTTTATAKSNPNDHLIISLSSSGGWGNLFDNVQMTFTPTN